MKRQGIPTTPSGESIVCKAKDSIDQRFPVQHRAKQEGLNREQCFVVAVANANPTDADLRLDMRKVVGYHPTWRRLRDAGRRG